MRRKIVFENATSGLDVTVEANVDVTPTLDARRLRVDPNAVQGDGGPWGEARVECGVPTVARINTADGVNVTADALAQRHANDWLSVEHDNVLRRFHEMAHRRAWQ